MPNCRIRESSRRCMLRVNQAKTAKAMERALQGIVKLRGNQNRICFWLSFVRVDVPSRMVKMYNITLETKLYVEFEFMSPRHPKAYLVGREDDPCTKLGIQISGKTEDGEWKEWLHRSATDKAICKVNSLCDWLRGEDYWVPIEMIPIQRYYPINNAFGRPKAGYTAME